MSLVGDNFRARMGPPDPAAAPGLRFETSEASFWEMLHEEVGAGFYLDGFLYLFGEGLEPLLPALEAWSFLVPGLPKPMVLGYNAFGSLLVLLDRADVNSRVGVLDPSRVVWWEPGTIAFSNLLGAWLPGARIPHFLDRAPYQAWRAAGGRRLRLGEMLSLKTPAALGGTFEPGNFEIADIGRYYEVSGPIYAKLTAKKGSAGAKRPRASRRRKR